LGGEAIMVVLQTIDSLVGHSTLLLRTLRSKIDHSVVAAGGNARRHDGEGHRGSQRQEQVASKRKHGGSPFKSPMLKTILSLGMEILHRPLGFALWRLPHLKECLRNVLGLSLETSRVNRRSEVQRRGVPWSKIWFAR